MAFHVPADARVTEPALLGTTPADGNNGAFDLNSIEPGWRLAVIASDGEGWEHVSLHAYRPRGQYIQSRTPTWREMVYVKDLCWDGEDVVMQLHPRKSAYVNNHPHVLHLWRPTAATIPEPPAYLLGLVGGPAEIN